MQKLNEQLIFACEMGQIEAAKLLIDLGANINALDGLALRWASKNGHTEIVKLLLNPRKGAIIRCNIILLSSSHWATFNRYAEIVELIRQYMEKLNEVL